MPAIAAHPRHQSTLRWVLAIAVAVCATVAAVPSAHAVPPLGNDSFGAPYNVDISGGEVIDITSEATTETGEPRSVTGPGYCTSGGVQRDMRATVWYRILGNGGTISIHTFGSNFNTVIAVYDAPTPVLGDVLPCNDDASGGTLQSAVSFQSVAGRAYLIQVGGCNACGGFDAGTIKMHVSATPPPAVLPPPPPPPPPPVIVVPPDGDGDGIPDSKDKCPTVKPTRDANNDGCQDKPQRILADPKYTYASYRRGGVVLGQAVKRMRLEQVPKGAKVRVSCARCMKADARGRTRGFRGYSFTITRAGTRQMPELRRVLMPRGSTLSFVVTAPGRLGRRVQLKAGRQEIIETARCLAAGSVTRPVPCSSGS